MSDGSWRQDFNPLYSSHNVHDFTEGNSWQYSWFVPHAPEDLISLMGGREAFISRLDSLFNTTAQVEGENASPDISGLIGQYAQGNEPSHHVAYLYNIAGARRRRRRLFIAFARHFTPTNLMDCVATKTAARCRLGMCSALWGFTAQPC
jgi:putative alpha-1,2-mannosidase